MRNTNNVKTEWEFDLWESVAERDVMKLRNQLQTMQRSSELAKNEPISNVFSDEEK
ncbi:MAG: hypothetical protein JXR61_14225 [Prolixibacteraceae bacterium]|nr:hypothetical protein [Prolixibacteraceae bacterium]